MISFVWSSKYPCTAGTGGSENYTVGQIRELARRGIACRMLTLGHGTDDGRADFPDIQFKALSSKDELSRLDDTLVFVTYPLGVPTKKPSYVILHCPPMSLGATDPLFDFDALAGTQPAVNSKFARSLWKGLIQKPRVSRWPVVYPFAEDIFGQTPRRSRSGRQVRILFAGRLTPNKGVYTLLAALHMPQMLRMDYQLSVCAARGETREGRILKKVLNAHPWVNVIKARKNPRAMAQLLAAQDIVVMPSTAIFWQEMFGILSVESQHAGCRVVASNAGGLPETNCGNLVLVQPDNPLALSQGIARTAAMGAVSRASRTRAAEKFTVKDSVDQLLAVIKHPAAGLVSRLDPQLPAPRISLPRVPGRRLPESANL